MKTDIFHLQILPIESILPHEEFDVSRARPLIKRFQEEGYLNNPIIVAAMDSHKYLQLDGMNRFSAFRLMKIPSILAQIIDYNDQDIVELSSWSHLFSNDKESFLRYIEKIPGLTVKKGKIEDVGHRYIKDEGMGRLCTVITKSGEVHLVSTNGTITEKVKKLTQLVSFYHRSILRDVLPATPYQGTIEFLFKEHFHTNIMLVFPTFTRHQIIDVVKHNQLFPPGVTRHIIKRRCLNFYMPLTFFKNKKSIDEQNRALEEKLLNRSFRLYEEPTIYFE